MLKSMMVLTLILFSVSVGMVWEARGQMRNAARLKAQGKPEPGIPLENLREYLGLFKRIMWFLVGILAVLVMVDRLGLNASM
ncbi:hypothetical protein [Denitratimonas sp. CY0512]|uniref:hypothetical protein n=1 Tax=Denitratimonas sp. CY0512 TaxID=3131940 RepID=UPI0030A59D75